jgi:hypothetical protein
MPAPGEVAIMRCSILLVLLLAASAYPGAQTRIDPPGPVFGPGRARPNPILFPVIAPRAPRARFDLLTSPSVLWAVAWTENRLFDPRHDPFRGGAFGFGRQAGVFGFDRRGGGFSGTTRIDNWPSGGWTPYGLYGYGGYFGVDPYGGPMASPPTSPPPSNPYGTYAPWSAGSGNPYGPYAATPAGSSQKPPPEKP